MEKSECSPNSQKGNKGDVMNYRFISLTCIVAKLMERIIQDELLIQTREQLNEHQHECLTSK